MTHEHIVRKFEQMGAKVTIRELEPIPEQTNSRNPNAPRPVVINIANDKKRGEIFTITTRGKQNLQVLDIDQNDKHLLLLHREEKIDGSKRILETAKFLCGHDERHWFVAGVNSSAKDIITAKNSLKSRSIINAEISAGINPFSKKAHKHRNKARTRQGEWWFVPADRTFGSVQIHKNEPIVRGRGKPHMCEELVRAGGETVMVSRSHPNGITMDEYNTMMKNNRDQMIREHWRSMTRGMTVYVRGRITHSDHKTLILRVWHRVEGNTERLTESVAFLD